MPDKLSHNDVAEQGFMNPVQQELLATIKIFQMLQTEIKATARLSKGSLGGLKPDSYENIKKIGEETTKVNKIFTEAEIIAKEKLKVQAKIDASLTKEVKELAALKVELERANKANKDNAKLTSDQTGAYDKLSIKLNMLRRSYKDLAAAGLEGAASSKILLKEIQDLDTKLKDVDASVGQHQRNVGNYASAFDGLGGAAGRAVNGFKGMLEQLKLVIANPIVLTLVAITGALKAMWEGIKMSDDGLTEMEAQMSKLGAVADVAKQRVGEFAKGLLKMFTGDPVNGLKQMKESFTGVGEQMYYATKAAYEFTYAMDAIEDASNAFISQEAKLRKAIAENLYLSKNQQLSAKERIEALRQAQADSKTIVEFKVNEAKELYNAEFNRITTLKQVNRNFLKFIIDADAEALQAKLKTSKTLQTVYNKIQDENIKHLEELKAGITNAEAAYFEENKRSEAQLSGFLKEQADARAAAHKAYLQKIKDLNLEFRQSEINLIQNDTERQRAQIEFNLQQQIRAIYEKYGLSKKSADLAINLTKKAEQEQADLIKAKQNEEKVGLIDLDGVRKKMAADQKEANKKRKAEEDKETKALADKTFQIVKSYVDKQNKAKIEAIDRELAASQRAADIQREQAAKGAQNASESLAFEKRRIAELQAAKDRQFEKQMRQEKALAIIKALASGNYKNVDSIKGIGSAIASFYDGTENTGEGGKADEKGGMLAILHPGERVMTKEQNKKAASLSNDQAANVLDLFNRGQLLNPTQFDRAPGLRDNNQWLQITELKRVQDEIKGLRNELKNRPVNKLEFDDMRKVVVETVKTQYKETRTEKKTGGLYGR